MEESESDVKKMVWGPWATAGFGVVVGIIFILVGGITILLFSINDYVSDPQQNLLQLFDKNSEEAFVLFIGFIACAIVCVGLIFLIIKLRKGSRIVEYLSLNPVTGRTLFRLFLLAAGMMMLSDSLSFFLGRPIVPQCQIDDYVACVWPVVFFIPAVIAAPVIEEIFFRGFLFEGFRQFRIGSSGAIILLSLLWTIIHVQYDIYDLTDIFVSGVVYGIVRIKTGSLWSCVFMHSIDNLIATIQTTIVVYYF